MANYAKNTGKGNGISKAETLDRDFANMLIEKMQSGNIPWRRDWSILSAFINATTGNQYQNSNILRLSFCMAEKHYTDPRFITFNQAQDYGFSVKKGEHGTPITFYTYALSKDKEKKNNELQKQWQAGLITEKELKENLNKPVPVLKYFYVFNIEQLEPIKNTPQKEFKPYKARETFIWNTTELAEKIISNSGAVIHYGESNKCFYSPSNDTITLPKKDYFKSAQGFYSTALHELSHWTGHSSRLNRKKGNAFGTADYAYEELVAEITACFITMRTGITIEPDNNSIAYLQSWIKALQSDYKYIFRACADAQKAADYLLQGIDLDSYKIDKQPVNDTLPIPYTANYPALIQTIQTIQPVMPASITEITASNSPLHKPVKRRIVKRPIKRPRPSLLSAVA